MHRNKLILGPFVNDALWEDADGECVLILLIVSAAFPDRNMISSPDRFLASSTQNKLAGGRV